MVKNIVFWYFNFASFSWPTEALFERFRNFPWYTTWWYTKENYETFQKVPQLATKNWQSYLYFLQNFGLEILKPSETSKNNSGRPKNSEIIQKLSILDFPFWRDHRKTRLSTPKGAISAKSTKSEKGVRLC